MSKQEFSGSVGKVVAVVLKDVVLSHRPVTSAFSQELHEELLWNFGEPKALLDRWDPKRSPADRVVADSASVVELLVVHADASVPDSLEVHADELHGHLLGNPLGEVVLVKDDFVLHYLFFLVN